MALATKCPHCTTIFRVAHDQLKLRGGIVRCGACNEVFDGNAALVEPSLKQPVIIDLPPPPTAPPATSPDLDALITTLDARHGGLPAAATASGPVPEALSARQAIPVPDAVPDWLAATPQATSAQDGSTHGAAPDTGPGNAPDAGLDLRLDVNGRMEAGLETEFKPGFTDGTGSAAAPGPEREQQSGMAEADLGPVLPAIPTLSHNAAALAAASPSDELFDLDLNVDVDDSAPSVHAPPPWDDKRTPLAEIRHALPGTRGAEIEALLLELDHGLEAAQQQEFYPGQEQPQAAPDHLSAPLEEAAGEPLRPVYPPLSALDDEDRWDTDPGAPADTDRGDHVDADGGRREPVLDHIDEHADEQADEHLTAVALHDRFDLDAYPPRAERDGDGSGLAGNGPEAGHEVGHEAAHVKDNNGDGEDDGDDDHVTLSHAAAGAQAGGAPALHGAGAAGAVTAIGAAAAATGPATPLSSGEAGAMDGEEPGFVKRDRRRKQFGKAGRIAMAAGIPLLLAALAAQVLGTFRNPLAAAVPALKPALVSACALAGCKVELPAQIDALSIEQGELQTLAGNLFSFGTTLRNGSRSAQAWPHIELILNDAADKPVLRRVFAPREYLAGAAGQAGSPAAPADSVKGFAPRSEQSVKLYFELAHVKASGYHIAVFYP